MMLEFNTLPQSLNGYPVIKISRHRNCATVMVAKPSSDAIVASSQISEFIVATWWPELGDSWSWGHYFPFRMIGQTEAEGRAQAEAAFSEAERRNERR